MLRKLCTCHALFRVTFQRLESYQELKAGRQAPALVQPARVERRTRVEACRAQRLGDVRAASAELAQRHGMHRLRPALLRPHDGGAVRVPARQAALGRIEASSGQPPAVVGSGGVQL